MTDKQSVENLLNQLNKLGLPVAYVRSLLPDWWNDKAAEEGTGLAELELILVRQFGLDAHSLFDENRTATFADAGTVKYKRSVRYDQGQLIPATSIALSCARIAAAATTTPLVTDLSVESIRKNIFQTGAKWLSLSGLIQFCWHHGIPVICVNDFPANCKRMDGMVVGVSDRPVIAISKDSPYSAWILFILAHELGHIALGHAQQGEILIDEAFDSDTSFLRDPDEDEMSATQFALQLLSNGYELPAELLGSTKPKHLAEIATAIGRQEKIDPGHLLLRNAFETNRWQLCVAALQVLQGTHPHGTVILQSGMEAFLNSDAIPKDNYKYLMKMAGINRAE